MSSHLTSAAGPTPGLLDRLTDRQMTLAVLLFGMLLYLPFAGSYGLFDPWETHYGEVARQMTVRNDFVSLYWPGSPLDTDHFWSKPVLTFWLMSLSMRLFGLGQPGGSPGEMALGTSAEWALRLPFCLSALLALYGVYLVAARLVSRRAAVLSVVVLATCPMFSLVARQAMTDMPFIGPMTMALALGTLALFEEDESDLPRRSWRRLSWPRPPLGPCTSSSAGAGCGIAAWSMRFCRALASWFRADATRRRWCFSTWPAARSTSMCIRKSSRCALPTPRRCSPRFATRSGTRWRGRRGCRLRPARGRPCQSRPRWCAANWALRRPFPREPRRRGPGPVHRREQATWPAITPAV